MNTEVDRKIAVILVADVVGYSKHMERDENATLKLMLSVRRYSKHVLRNIKDLSLAETPLAVPRKCC